MARRKPEQQYFTTIICPFCGYIDNWARDNDEWVCSNCDELIDEEESGLNENLMMGFAEGTWEEEDV
jgi:hypothetical protein